MNRIICLAILTCLVVTLPVATASRAEDIVISDIQVTTIESPDSVQQCALILDFDIPDEIDSSRIMFVELIGRVAYELPDSLPMTLACVPIPSDQEIDWQSFENLQENLSELFDLSKLSTASFGGSSSDTTYFDITDTFKSWVQESAISGGLLIIPVETNSVFIGFNEEDPMLGIRISHMTSQPE